MSDPNRNRSSRTNKLSAEAPNKQPAAKAPKADPDEISDNLLETVLKRLGELEERIKEISRHNEAAATLRSNDGVADDLVTVSQMVNMMDSLVLMRAMIRRGLSPEKSRDQTGEFIELVQNDDSFQREVSPGRKMSSLYDCAIILLDRHNIPPHARTLFNAAKRYRL